MRPIIQSLLAGLVRRRTERVLSDLDDHLLRDIGITRHEISMISRDRTAFDRLSR